MGNSLFFLNSCFFILFTYLLCKSWSYTATLFIVEGLWVLLYCLCIYVVPAVLELPLYMFAILVLVLAAVELVLGLLCFIIFYHVINKILPTSAFKTKITTLYETTFSKIKAFLQKFF